MKRVLALLILFALPGAAAAASAQRHVFSQLDFSAEFPSTPTVTVVSADTARVAAWSAAQTYPLFTVQVELTQGKLPKDPTDDEVQAMWSSLRYRVGHEAGRVVAADQRKFKNLTAMRMRTKNEKTGRIEESLRVLSPKDGYLYTLSVTGAQKEVDAMRDRFWDSFEHLKPRDPAARERFWKFPAKGAGTANNAAPAAK
ncbi:MAG: hypothetical protein JO102_04155 [Elusimicrobia bacterium]|nr:hypothetical protein [Elusimicrobiota bacterium]